MINMPSSVVGALASESYRTAILVNLPGTGFKITDNHKPITYSGTTFTTDDQMVLKTSGVKRTGSINAGSYSITFAGADRSAYEEYYQDAYYGQAASISLAFLNDDYELLAGDSVLKMYSGLVDSWQLSEGKTTSDFTIKMTSHWAAFEVVTGRFTNTSSQEEYFPGDTFFQYSTQEKLPIKWGS